MKALTEKRWTRVLALVMFFVFLTLSSLASAVVFYGRSDGWYRLRKGSGFEETDGCLAYVYDGIWYVSRNVIWMNDLENEALGSYAGAAFSYVIRDEKDRITADTRTDRSVYVGATAEELFTVEGYVNLPVEPYDGCYAEYISYTTFFSLRYLMLAMKILFLLLAAGALAVLFLGAVRRGREGALRPQRLWPYDVVLAGAAVSYFVLDFLLDNFLDRLLWAFFSYAGEPTYHRYYWAFLQSFGYFLILSILAFLLWYLAGQLGAGVLHKNLLLSRALRHVPAEVVVLGLLAVHVLILLYSPELILLAFDAAAAVVLILHMRQARRVRQAAEELAQGNLSYKTDTKRLHFIWRALGERLNSIGDGMAEAVEERMRSERMKTELITNVSHDLKTPLTSIVNYVDLLQSDSLDGETRRAYLDVLDKQSARLKKLTEDVVEASKAASGALTLAMEPIDMAELLEQFAGEYAGRMEDAGVELVLTAPEEDVRISADSVLLGRVIDNLLNNVAKYAQPGTRAYIDLGKAGGRAVLTFKNISREPLNITADELMERFVRGDSARHTEGSGLGLSIAQSLTELMGGKLELVLDGDLFKAELVFQCLTADEKEGAVT